ncbi:hypothetical protein SAMN05443252_102504 [Bacillus sp. OV322]|uniref:DUF5344 family protein n=1 Tax=Bacillus sp. OV322 TaxID=1882764 RepID=UPI0008E318BE|nr:DUF5344 family protein [Bacillus sp. OV322]SFC27363.1 hypothetical protein SAMN05443252_102504 [Bacillus sp. OV322]
MSNKINIRIQEIEASLEQMRTSSVNVVTKIPFDEMSPNNLSVTREITLVNQNLQKVIEQYKALLLIHIDSTKKSAYEMLKADEKVAQDISSSTHG